MIRTPARFTQADIARATRATPAPDLLAARNAALTLRKRRPDLEKHATDLARNIELQLRYPDDPDLKAAAVRLVRAIGINLP